MGLIEPNKFIGVLVMRFCVGNKRLQREVSKLLEVHEENIFIDSGLTKEGRKGNSTSRHYKEGQVDEVERKFSRRDVSVMKQYQKVEVKTKKSY